MKWRTRDEKLVEIFSKFLTEIIHFYDFMNFSPFPNSFLLSSTSFTSSLMAQVNRKEMKIMTKYCAYHSKQNKLIMPLQILGFPPSWYRVK